MFHYSVIFMLNFIVTFINIIIIVLFCRHWPFQPTWHSKKTQEVTIRAQLISSALRIKSYEYPTCSNLKKAMGITSAIANPCPAYCCHQKLVVVPRTVRWYDVLCCAARILPLKRLAQHLDSSDWWISSWPNWLVNRDPYNGLSKSLYNWVV